MDFAAATPIHPRILREMRRGFDAYGNPSAPHTEGQRAAVLLEKARLRIARALSAKPGNIIMTGSGTEANNLAIFGVMEALVARGAKPEDLHIITSIFEHSSLEGPVAYWARRGASISLAEPTEEGIITPEAVEKLIRPETALVSVVAVQSEIGQVQPVKEISRMLKRVREKRAQRVQTLVPETAFPILHSDASQSPLFADLSPERLGVDLATYDAQKVMGPKGVGALYKHSSVPLEPLMRGGTQERSLRAGTENVAGALGFALALELAAEGRDVRISHVKVVRDYLAERILKEIPHAVVNGGMKHRIANNLNISVPGADGDYLSVLMDAEGVAVSPRSACLAPGSSSQAVNALRREEPGGAYGTLRFSLAPDASKRDARQAVAALKRALAITRHS